MNFANYCFIPAYCTSTDQSCDTREPVLVTMGFDAWRRELDMGGEHCCNLYNTVATDVWVRGPLGKLFTSFGPILRIFSYSFAN